MDTFGISHVNNLILEKQHLTEDSKIDNILQITKDICGLHSTNLITSYLSLFVRTNNFKKADLDNELFIKKNLGRIRGMRRTLFIQTKNMIPIVIKATFNLIKKTFEKYMEFHKVSSEEYRDTSHLIIKFLKGKELSASEIRKAINSKSNIPAIIQLMCNNCLLIRARPIKDWKDRRIKYALFSDYFPTISLNKINEKDAIRILIEKYIKAYGPVSENDISWWTGLRKLKIRESLKEIKSQLTQINLSSMKGTFLIKNTDINQLQNLTRLDKPSIVFLPALDPYPMGYKERDRYLSETNYKYVFDRSGNITSVILLDGVVIGVWDVEEKPDPIIKFHLFHSIEDYINDTINLKAKRLGQFYFDKKVNIRECDSMSSLTERPAGGFMTPLKNC